MANILVVDDDPTARDLAVTVLGYGGHQLREAADGAEALIEAQSRPPELIIADLLMPTMDGFEFVRRLREHEALAQTPVIFYTATYLETEVRNLARACGVTDIITKPAEPQHILDAVSRNLGTLPAPVAPPPRRRPARPPARPARRPPSPSARPPPAAHSGASSASSPRPR